MKKVISSILVVLMVCAALFALAACKEEEVKADIYTIANNSPATEVTTSIQYTTADGEVMRGWYVTRSSGNDAIFEYEFDRYITVDEAVETGTNDRIKTVKGKIYYIGGKYIDSTGEGGSAPWVGSPSDMRFKFSISKDLLISPIVSADGNTLSAAMTAESCAAMFGLDFAAKDEVYLTVVTNSVTLQEVRIQCETVTGASINMITTYAPTSVELDFSEILGEEE